MKTVAELQQKSVVMELECIDRMYLNAYVPKLTSDAGVASFVREHLGYRFASTKQVAEITESFVERIHQFALDEQIPVVRFEKGQRKDDVMKEHLRRFRAEEGVVFIGVAQEKARVPRTVRKKVGEGGTIPWISSSKAMVNHYYFYGMDGDLGPFFIKFCSYFPYASKVCLNGHEYLKRQLDRRGIAYRPLDNGLAWCEDVVAAQRLCDGFSEVKIEAFYRKWLRRLPHPFDARARQAGYRYDLSILQAEFSLTQIWEKAVHGRCFFEQVIRENIDLGRPEAVQLIFGRKQQRSTVAQGRNRTRIITEGVIPSLHVYYKNTHLKQYHKALEEGAGLRTETTINNTYDFGVGRRLHNLSALREIGFRANRRMLEVEKVSHDCRVGAEAFERLQRPVEVAGQHGSALRYGEARVQALLAVLVLFSLQPEGFRNKQLRPLLAQSLGWSAEEMTQGRMSYDLRRLRLHGLIERIEGSHRYRLTEVGLRTALFYSRSYQRLLRAGLSEIYDPRLGATSALARAFSKLETELKRHYLRTIGSTIQPAQR
jgi:hypothetical protein